MLISHSSTRGGEEVCVRADSSHLIPEFCPRVAHVFGDVKHVDSVFVQSDALKSGGFSP